MIFSALNPSEIGPKTDLLKLSWIWRGWLFLPLCLEFRAEMNQCLWDDQKLQFLNSLWWIASTEDDVHGKLASTVITSY